MGSLTTASSVISPNKCVKKIVIEIFIETVFLNVASRKRKIY